MPSAAMTPVPMPSGTSRAAQTDGMGLPPVPMPGSEAAPTAGTPGGDGNVESGPTGGGNNDDNRRRLMTILAAAAVVVALLAVGTLLFTRHQTTAMADTCRQEQDRLTSLATTLDKTMKQAKDAAGTDGGKLNDAGTLTALKTAISDTTTPDTAKLDCSADQPFRQLKANAEQLKEAADQAGKDNDSLAKAVDAVTASRDGKSLADSRKSLNDSITKAESILSKAKGNVSDQNTITTLQTSIDNAKKVANGSNPTLTDITKANKDLTAAIDKVNNSMTAKQNADRTLQQQQQQAQQEQQADIQRQQQSQSQSQSSGGTQTTGAHPYGSYFYAAPVGGFRETITFSGNTATSVAWESGIGPKSRTTTTYSVRSDGGSRYLLYDASAQSGKSAPRVFVYDASAHTVTDKSQGGSNTYMPAG
ncbi:FIVAR domain-containing protein [Bifidobacterium sp. 82T24]|nr:FIVAR domain-containing protein [Bifidobacterium pluvialisilvae]